MTTPQENLRAWLALALTILITAWGGSLGLFFRAEAYADNQDAKMRSEICGQITELRTDIRALDASVRAMLIENAKR